MKTSHGKDCMMKIVANTITPSNHDILFGRGKQYQDHVGNKRFRAVISMNMPRYGSPTARRHEKTRITYEIVEEFYNDGCRFLKKDANDCWHDVGIAMARHKVAHALRDTSLEMRRALGDPSTTKERLYPVMHLKRHNSLPNPCLDDEL
jgi:hypothetical protein